MLTRKAIDQICALGPWLMIAGLVFMVLRLAMSGMFLLGLGATAGSLRGWKTEPGLWMLGALFGASFGMFQVAFVYFSVVDFFAGRGPAVGILAVDISLSSAVLTVLVRFCWSVTHRNRDLVRRSESN